MPFLVLVYAGVLVWALIDLLTSPDWRVRGISKVSWALVILFVPLVGPIAWVTVGKDRRAVLDAGHWEAERITD